MLVRYLPPAAPTLRSAPPSGEQWLHRRLAHPATQAWSLGSGLHQEWARPFKSRPLDGRRPCAPGRRAVPDYRRRARGVGRRRRARFLSAAFSQTRSRPLRVGLRPVAPQRAILGELRRRPPAADRRFAWKRRNAPYRSVKKKKRIVANQGKEFVKGTAYRAGTHALHWPPRKWDTGTEIRPRSGPSLSTVGRSATAQRLHRASESGQGTELSALA